MTVPATPALSHLELVVTGMTCTSCSSRVQRKLNKVDGVDASVNFSTETANVDYDPARTDPGSLIEVIRGAGYDAFPLSGGGEHEEGGAPLDDARERETAELRRTAGWSALVSLPVLLVSMVPSWQFTNWQWAAFAATTLVYFAAGSVFHRATLVNLRHGTTTMDTLISLGTTAAYLWSVWALFLGTAGAPGMRMHMSLLPAHAGHGMGEIYLETVCVVTSARPVVRVPGQGTELTGPPRAARHGREGCHRPARGS